MKLRYFIPSLVAVVAAMFTGCSDNDYDPTYLSEIRVSQSYVALDVNGGSASVDVNTVGAWTVTDVPDWLTVSPASGSGSGTITFTAGAGVGRTAEVLINCEGKTQRINIIQGIATVSNATCAEVIAGPDSKTYRVTGVVKSIANTTYGNWYLEDKTGEVYIYGTLDKKGAEKNFLSLGIEVGDEVTVEGPKTTYNGTVELVNVTVVKISKSLIKCDSLSIADATLPLEGGEITAYLTCKGTGVAVEIPEDAKDWLGVVSSTVGANPTVTFRAAPNTGGARNTTVTFKTTDGKKEYTSQTTINQAGAIIQCSVADFLAAAVGDAQYSMTGVISGVYASDKQGRSFYLRDWSGETLIYRCENFTLDLVDIGDVVTVVGKRGAYKDSPQMVDGKIDLLEEIVVEVSIADFLTKPDSKEDYYMVSGTVTEIANDTYGNLYISDGTNTLYVYGCYPGWGATGDNRKGAVAKFGIAVGDKLTVIGPKSTYKDVPQVNGGIFFSVEKAQ